MTDLQTPRGDGETRSNLIVNYLPQSITDKELYSMFVTIGPIESCRVMKDYKTGYSYGFGFVNYQKPEDAARAIYTLNGLQIQNKRLKVSYARPCSEDIKDTNLYVTNLPRNMSEEQLEDVFSKFGTIVQKNLLKDKVTGMPRGVAFVRYDKKDQAQAAISGLNGTIPEGGTDPICVKIAEEHARGRGGMAQQRNQMSPNYGGPMPGGRGYQQNYNNAMRPNKMNNRYNPIGVGGGYNMYNWS